MFLDFLTSTRVGFLPLSFHLDNGFQLAFVLPSAQRLKKVAEIEVLRNKTGLSFALYFSKRIDEGSTVVGGQWASPGSAGCETLPYPCSLTLTDEGLHTTPY